MKVYAELLICYELSGSIFPDYVTAMVLRQSSIYGITYPVHYWRAYIDVGISISIYICCEFCRGNVPCLCYGYSAGQSSICGLWHNISGALLASVYRRWNYIFAVSFLVMAIVPGVL